MLGAARLYTTAWGLLKQPDKHKQSSQFRTFKLLPYFNQFTTTQGRTFALSRGPEPCREGLDEQAPPNSNRRIQ
jgi:hypothetical protein